MMWIDSGISPKGMSVRGTPFWSPQRDPVDGSAPKQVIRSNERCPQAVNDRILKGYKFRSADRPPEISRLPDDLSGWFASKYLSGFGPIMTRSSRRDGDITVP